MTGYKIGMRDTKKGKKVLVVGVDVGGPRPQIIWHQTMALLIVMERMGIDINKIVKEYAATAKKMKTEVMPQPPKKIDLDDLFD